MRADLVSAAPVVVAVVVAVLPPAAPGGIGDVPLGAWADETRGALWAPGLTVVPAMGLSGLGAFAASWDSKVGSVEVRGVGLTGLSSEGPPKVAPAADVVRCGPTAAA